MFPAIELSQTRRFINAISELISFVNVRTSLSLFGVRQQKTLCVKSILVNKRINPGGQACVSVDSLTIVIEHKQLGIGTCCVELNVSRPELLLNGESRLLTREP